MLHRKLPVSKQFLLNVVIILFAICLRAVFYNSYPFGFDQIQIAENAAKIVQLNLTLIGPRTGPAEMFTGPLIYYLAAPFALIMHPAFTTVAVALSLSLLTGSVLYFVSRKYLPTNYPSILLTLWGFSPLLIHFDRIPWNPNITLLAASLAFFPLLKKEKLTLLDYILLSAGVFLGYQAHFSGLLLLPLVIVTLVLRREFKYITIPFLAFICSLLPTVLFDYRHNWLNYHGLLAMISNKDSVSQYMIGSRIFEKVYIVVETTGKVFFEGNSSTLILSAGIILNLAFVYTFWKTKQLKLSTRMLVIPFVWMGATIVAFSLYRNSTPEYYFFILLPVLLFIITRVLSYLTAQPVYVLLIAAIQASFFLPMLYKQPKTLAIGEQYAVAQKIKELASQSNVAALTYDMPAIDTLGLRYFLQTMPVQLSSGGNTIHITRPPHANILSETYTIGSFQIWLDLRNADYNYIELENYFIGVPQTWQVAEIKVPASKDAIETTYILQSSAKVDTLLTVIKKNSELTLFSPYYSDEDLAVHALPLKNNSALFWNYTKSATREGYYYETSNAVFFTSTTSPEIVSTIEIIAR